MGSSRISGRVVVLSLVGLCVLGCIGTIWRYGRLHETSLSARVETRDGRPLIIAEFADTSRMAPGQKATVSLIRDSGKKIEGSVLEVRGATEATILVNSSLNPGESARITVETPAP